MRKKSILTIATTLIILLLILPPIAKAGVVHYYWDNVVFILGTDIKYAHPDNVYYDIDKYSDWSKRGQDLYHNQVNKDTTYQILVGSVAFFTFLGTIVTAWLGGTPMASVVGGLTGVALGTIVSLILDYYFVDERGCIWWWISRLFVYYLEQNLPALSIGDEGALAAIISAFLCFGYLRIGKVIFNDPTGIGSPSHTLTISVSAGGTTVPVPGTYTYGDGMSVTVTASASSNYAFSFWDLDGETKFGNPITVTMNSDHTLKAYFQGGGGGIPRLPLETNATR